MTPTFGSFDEEGFDEHLFEHGLANNPGLALAEGWYWIRKLQARFFAGDYAGALEASGEGATAAVDIAVNVRNGRVSLL